MLTHVARTRWPAAVIVAVALAGCGGGIPGDAVVSVDGTPITKARYDHWLSVAATSGAVAAAGKPVVPDPPRFIACIAHAKAQAKLAKGKAPPTEAQLKPRCEQQYKSLQQEVLGFLISSTWVQGEASSLGVNVSDSEVNAQFEKIKSQQFPKPAEFQRFLSNSGQTLSDLLLRVKLNLLSSKIQQRILKQRSNPTQAQIARYYRENPGRFGAPERRNLLVILTRNEAQAKRAKQEIKSGKSFASIAKRASIDPTSRSSGGRLQGVVRGREPRALDAAVFAAKENVLTGPVKTPAGYYIFAVQTIAPASRQILKQAEPSIRAQLTATAQQSALSRFTREFKTRWTAKTNCRTGYVVADCKQYKTPATATSPTGAATP